MHREPFGLSMFSAEFYFKDDVCLEMCLKTAAVAWKTCKHT